MRRKPHRGNFYSPFDRRISSPTIITLASICRRASQFRKPRTSYSPSLSAYSPARVPYLSGKYAIVACVPPSLRRPRLRNTGRFSTRDPEGATPPVSAIRTQVHEPKQTTPLTPVTHRTAQQYSRARDRHPTTHLMQASNPLIPQYSRCTQPSTSRIRIRVPSGLGSGTAKGRRKSTPSPHPLHTQSHTHTRNLALAPIP